MSIEAAALSDGTLELAALDEPANFEQPAPADVLTADSVIEQVERMVPYKGEYYPESKLRELCPHLASLGEVAYKLVVDAHIKAEEKTAEPSKEEPKQEPIKVPAGHQKPEAVTTKVAVEVPRAHELTRSYPEQITDEIMVVSNESRHQNTQNLIRTELPNEPIKKIATPTTEKPELAIIETDEQTLPTDSIAEPDFNTNTIDKIDINPVIPVAIDFQSTKSITAEHLPTPDKAQDMVAEIKASEPEESAEAITEISVEKEVFHVLEEPLDQFEQFMASIPEPLTPPTLEIIRAEADELPLDEAFAQIAQLIEATAPELTVELREIIATAYDEIMNLAINELDDPILTPAIIEKTVILLRYIGYQNAEEVLELCMAERGIEFLADALRYLSQLNAEDNNQEFWQLFTAKKHYKLAARPRLGKMLLEVLGIQQLIIA